MAEIKWRVKVTYTAVISKDQDGQPVLTEAGVKHAAAYPLSSGEHQEQDPHSMSFDVTAVEIDGRWYEAPPF